MPTLNCVPVAPLATAVNVTVVTPSLRAMVLVAVGLAVKRMVAVATDDAVPPVNATGVAARVLSRWVTAMLAPTTLIVVLPMVPTASLFR